MPDTVAAVVVTFNRKDLLIECLDALLAQTRVIDRIFVIDNASTDGTQELLKERGYLANPVVENVRLTVNTGGAGGFHAGVRAAYGAGYDWAWLMDDDTIPARDALENLVSSALSAASRVNLGFVASRVVWTDGEIHRMNIPWIASLAGGIPFNSLDDSGTPIIISSSFVSVLVSRRAISVCGFPLAAMYIWGDDTEFFSRITRRGFVGIYCSKSRAVHKTKQNYSPDLLTDEESNLWRYRYGVRNTLYIQRMTRGTAFYCLSLVYQLTVKNVKILLFRKDNRAKAVLLNTLSAARSAVFNPRPVIPQQGRSSGSG